MDRLNEIEARAMDRLDRRERLNNALLKKWDEEQKEEIKHKEELEPFQKKSRLQPPPSVPISDFEMIPHISDYIPRFTTKFFQCFPGMAWMVWRKNFTPLQKFKGSKVDIKYGIPFDIIALCIWFLYIEVPSSVKDFAAWTLVTFYNATFRDKDKFVTDQMSVDDLVKAGLLSRDNYVLNQVSCSLSFLASYRHRGDYFAQDVTFGPNVLNCLLDLVIKHDSPFEVFALFKIAKADQGMRDIIVNREIKQPFLSGLLKSENVFYLTYVLKTIACLTRPNHPRWDEIEGRLIPDICSLNRTYLDDDVWVAVARVLNRALHHTTPEQIDELVKLGCLEGLCYHLELEDSKYLKHSLEAIKYILQAGDEENKSGNKYENKYAKYIAGNIDWSVFKEVPWVEGFGFLYIMESRELRLEYAGEDYV